MPTDALTDGDKTMRRWMLKAGVTDIDDMVLEDVAMPVPGPGQVRVRIQAVSLNFRDQLVLTDPTWRIPGRDIVPVSDGAGEIDAIGPEVDAWSVGDRVTPLYFRDWFSGPPTGDPGRGLGSLGEDGLLAEYVVLPAGRLIRAPESLDAAGAATLPCAGLTAWSALKGDQPIGPGSLVLVLGTGGVSLMAAVLAQAAGAQVIATTSRDANRAFLETLGVSDIVNYRESPNWGAVVFDRLGGVDRVVNSVGTSEMAASLTALRRGGEVSLLGLRSMESAPMDAAMLLAKGAVVRMIGVGSAESHAEMVQFVDAHEVKPPIGRQFRFEDAKDAYRAQVSPDVIGKIVIDVS